MILARDYFIYGLLLGLSASQRQICELEVDKETLLDFNERQRCLIEQLEAHETELSLRLCHAERKIEQMQSESMLHGARLTPRGLAFCRFAFRDGPAIGLSDKEAYETAERLIEQWDGGETLLEIYKRTVWPETISE